LAECPPAIAAALVEQTLDTALTHARAGLVYVQQPLLELLVADLALEEGFWVSHEESLLGVGWWGRVGNRVGSRIGRWSCRRFLR
jgi:hypothetical protein